MKAKRVSPRNQVKKAFLKGGNLSIVSHLSKMRIENWALALARCKSLMISAIVVRWWGQKFDYSRKMGGNEVDTENIDSLVRIFATKKSRERKWQLEENIWFRNMFFFLNRNYDKIFYWWQRRISSQGKLMLQESRWYHFSEITTKWKTKRSKVFESRWDLGHKKTGWPQMLTRLILPWQVEKRQHTRLDN